MEFNTELILLSDNISTSVILPLDNTSYSNINYCYYNNVYLSWDSYFSLNDNILFSYIENIENNQDNKKLLEAVNNKTNENENMSLLLKEMQLQNKINKDIEDNQIKLIMKATEFQNEYFKKKEKK